jgi:hypothetical protein
LLDSAPVRARREQVDIWISPRLEDLSQLTVCVQPDRQPTEQSRDSAARLPVVDYAPRLHEHIGINLGCRVSRS